MVQEELLWFLIQITMVPNSYDAQVASLPPHQPRPFLLVDFGVRWISIH